MAIWLIRYETGNTERIKAESFDVETYSFQDRLGKVVATLNPGRVERVVNEKNAISVTGQEK